MHLSKPFFSLQRNLLRGNFNKTKKSCHFEKSGDQLWTNNHIKIQLSHTTLATRNLVPTVTVRLISCSCDCTKL